MKLDCILALSFQNSILWQYDIFSKNLESIYHLVQLCNHYIFISNYILSKKILNDQQFLIQTDLITVCFFLHLVIISNPYYSTKAHLNFEIIYYSSVKYYGLYSKLLHKFYIQLVLMVEIKQSEMIEAVASII